MSAADRERIETITKRWEIFGACYPHDMLAGDFPDLLSQLSALSEALSAAQQRAERDSTEILASHERAALLDANLGTINRERVQVAEALSACQQERDYGKKRIASDADLLKGLHSALTACRAQGEARERDLAQMFSDGVDVARSYGDNAFHLHSEQLERQFQRALARMRAGEGQNVQPRAALSSTPTEPKT